MRPHSRASVFLLCQLLLLGLSLARPTSVWSQTVVATIPAGSAAVAVNPTTGNIYTTTCILNQRKQAANGSVTVIDGKTYATTTLAAGVCPAAVAVNSVTNKIYVANAGQISIVCGSCFNFGSITVIDGLTNATTEISDPNAKFPAAIAVNSSTNTIYVANSGTNNVTVIDGITNATLTITDPNAFAPAALAVNASTNKIYVANEGDWQANHGNVTVIDGATNTTATVTDPNALAPHAVAVNPKTNKIYVANQGSGYPGPNHGNITIIEGATNSTATVTDPDAVAPQAVAVNLTTNRIYVANINDTSLSEHGGVSVIDGATNLVISVKDPNAIAPIAVAVDQLRNKVYVANDGSRPQFSGNNPGCVTVIDGATNTPSTVIDPKANGPHAVAINAHSGPVKPIVDRIYVANSGNVTVIDGGATAESHVLSVLVEGTGSGMVTSSPAGIDCGTACSAGFAVDTPVSLSASAASGSQFAGWSGPCGGTGSCNLMANEDQFVTATFNSTSPVQVAVPNVVGQTQAAATAAITSAGLVVGTVTQQSSSTVASGDVISQAPAAGTDTASGSAVSLVVSTGGSSSGSSSSGHGGGGGLDSLALCALLAALTVRLKIRLRKRAMSERPATSVVRPL